MALSPEALAEYRSRKARIKHLYGLDIDDYMRMIEEQFWECAICGAAIDFTSAHVDHCHRTKKVRALLCHNCNVGLGHFGHSWSRLAKACQYILKHLKTE